MSVISAPTTTLRGYRASPSVQRAGFWTASAFATTVGTSRALNYVRERRRPLPRLRSWGRGLYHSPRQQEARVHHHLPGIAGVLTAGGAAVLTRTDGAEHWFAIPFGIGAGLTLDELAILAQLHNPYWESERFSIIQAALGTAVAGALALAFYRRGATTREGAAAHEDQSASVGRPGDEILVVPPSDSDL